MKFKALCSAILLSLSGVVSYGYADPAPTQTAYQNFYVTYMSPADVKAAVNYANSQGIHRFFMWTVDQDAPASSANSLIGAMNQADPNAYIATYFPNYASYNNQRAIPSPSYTIAGSAADLDPKLNASNELVYAFAETQVPTTPVQPGQAPVGDMYINTPNSYGAVYIYDPWSDLAAGDGFCGQSNLPSGVPVDTNGYNLICGYAFDNTSKYHNQYNNTAQFNSFGNMEAFSNLSTTVQGKTSQPIITSLSIGGFGHDATYEAIFDPAHYGVTTVSSSQAMTNFVHSLLTLLNHYHIQMVDLDYENVSMSPAQSQAYHTLLEQLNTALAANTGSAKYFTIASISNPQYIAGTESGGTIGFAPGVLKSIAALSQFQAFDLMTYDFSGIFNYNGPANPGTTGFLTNVYPPNDANTPSGYDFSVQQAVAAALAAGVPAAKIGVGIPAYGRALASLPGPSADGSYLFSPLSSSVVIPAGDQDPAGCTQDLPDEASSTSCQAMFSYHYIMDHIVGHPENGNVTATDHQDNSGNVFNGTTAFGSSWNVPTGPAYTLTIVNNNAASGQIAVGPWSTGGYLPTGTRSYPASVLSLIEGQSGLAVSFTYWKQTVSCGTADFTHNLTITISSDAVPTCTVQ